MPFLERGWWIERAVHAISHRCVSSAILMCGSMIMSSVMLLVLLCFVRTPGKHVATYRMNTVRQCGYHRFRIMTQATEQRYYMTLYRYLILSLHCTVV